MDINKEKNTEFKYLRLIVPVELHTKLLRYQAMKILSEDKKEPLSNCVVELLYYATKEINNLL